MDDDDEFYDTISVQSQFPGSKRRSRNLDYMSLSRNTVYHSACDLEALEMNDVSEPRRPPPPPDRVPNDPKTYSQWRDRVK